MVIKKIYIFIALLVLLSYVGGDEAKGSVVFVIDDTGSMEPELKQVTARTDDIFEAVLKSNSSQIDEFIIVTFNDPAVYCRVKTNESLEFKSALEKIIPYNGYDCPEMAMTGIQRALNESKPHSFLYVFTDASAKDYILYDNVKALAQEKSIQVNFLLTGDCEGKIKEIIEKQQTAYDNLAAATSGQVFHIFKDDVDKIIEYILANLRSKRINLLRKTYGYKCENSAFTVDSKVWDILIALSSSAPLNHNDLVVHGPHGDNITSLEGLINSQNTSIYKMQGKPGEYSIKKENCAHITLVVSASTSVSFRHGFSSVKPSTLDETSTKPVFGTESYLAIALTNEERDVTLKSVEIRDMDNKLIAPLLTLHLIDDEKQFYITDLFTPPKETFTISVIGYTKSNEKITRVSQTSMEYNETQRETQEVPIINKNKIIDTILSGTSVDIECRLIQGKPDPVISWSFDRDSAGKFIHEEKETREKIHIDHVTKNDAGTYRCDVSNVAGTDHHEMQLHVKYAPPIVKISPNKSLESKTGELVILTCEVDGSPAPIVRWYKNDSQIYNGRKYTIYPDFILSFTGLISDSGNYSCKASNDLGTVSAGVSVFIYVPIKIKTPGESKFDVQLGRRLILPCETNGYPEPNVQWFHYFTHPRKPYPEKINCDINYNVILDTIQFEDEGFYKCTAVNNIDSDEITYTVKVQVPAAIERIKETNLHVVEGDSSFVLTCPATGSPKPTIKWHRDGIEIGSDASFMISRDGSLTVYNVVSRHTGTYTCTAQNQYGNDTMNYEVYVHEFPPTEPDPVIITIIEGEKKKNMYCGMFLKEGYVVRWFKDGVFIKEGNLTLTDVTKDKAGYYCCRLSTPERSYSFGKRVIVGTEPKFITADNPTVMFKDGAEATLDCSATGDPLPTIIWWYEHIKIINADSNQYTLKMDVTKIGNYWCHVSNILGTIKRSFDIISGECLMSLENDFTARQPMLVTGKNKLELPMFNVSGGTLRMQKYREFKLVCPNAFISYDNTKYGSILETSCVGDAMFKLRGRDVKASEITCDRPIVPLTKHLSRSVCRGSNTKWFNVGFDVNGFFVSVFSVCLNERSNTTLFVTYRMHKDIANTIPKYVAGYTRSTLLRIQFEDIYDCRNQEYAISTFMGKTVDKKCCFKRRQLANPMDVLPGISQVATYHYLNVVPHWSCSTENWEEAERRVRQYAINSQDKIRIWTGASVIEDEPTIHLKDKQDVPTINLKDKLGQELKVPQFIWKVVERQLAIIHINVPGLTSPQANSYTLCPDICDSIDWMRHSQWHDYDKGFIYCCSIKEFERVFNYDYIFK